ncbi:MAG TPA: CYTH domain-containing protein [Streptosporangiaceae bacterium]
MAADPGGFIETERKYEAGADFTLPDLAGLAGAAGAGGPRTDRLRAVYFDTAGFALAAARITLRRRTGGPDAGWHLKLPAGTDRRREVHAPLGDGTEPVPAELAALVADWTGGQPLRPVARLDTSRTVLPLAGPDGQVLAEIADDMVTGWLPDPGEGEWRAASAWREIEVELGTGTTDLLDAVGDRLLRAGAVPSAAASKLSRLLSAAG